MKTLDEVIFEAPYTPTPWEVDALYYLKEYSEYIPTIEKKYHDTVTELNSLKDEIWKYENFPLTWDELKSMEGRPVWIVSESLSVGVRPYRKDCYIIKSFSNDEFMYCNDGFKWAKEMQGRLWQAYRKERE